MFFIAPKWGSKIIRGGEENGKTALVPPPLFEHEEYIVWRPHTAAISSLLVTGYSTVS